MNLTFDVSTENQTLTRTDKNNIIGDSIGYLFAVFTVDDSSLIYSVLFNRASVNPVTVLGNKQGNIVTAEVPSSMLKSGTFRISIVGNSEDGQKRIPFRDESISVGPSGYNEGAGFEVAEKSVYEQLLAAVRAAGITDAQIESAVSTYLNAHPVATLTESDVNGFIKTFFNEHKAELKGDTGATGATGTAGINGTNGINGKSAYEIAVETGYTGTELQWLQSLVGATGATGAKGDTGAQGLKGDKGDTGTSAYQTAVNNGFTGTEAQWLASLVGANGSDLVNQGVIDGTSSGDATKTLVANTMIIITQPVTSLTLSLPTTYNTWDEFRFAFTTGSTFTGLTLNGVTYLGDTPTIAVSKYYEGSIVNGKAVVFG